MRNLLTIMFLILLTVQVRAYSTGPPDGRANNPPNYQNCTQCHNSFILNSGVGSLELTGLPSEGFEAGQTCDLTLTLTDPGQVRWGFEIAVQYQSGASYPQAGTLTVTDPTHTQISTAGGVQFFKTHINRHLSQHCRADYLEFSMDRAGGYGRYADILLCRQRR